MEDNPCAAPVAVDDDMRVGDLEGRKASRGKRLGAALLDYLLLLLCVAPMLVHHGWEVLGAVMLLILLAMDLALLNRNGQTVGKLALGIRIVRSDGSDVGLGRIIGLRVLPMNLLGRLPMVGGLIVLVDVLAIFARERRCLHDLIADTIVVDA